MAVPADAAFYCRTCQYPLRGLSETRCPECGTTFDLNDVTSMNVGRPTSNTVRRWLQPPGKIFIGLVAVNVLVILAATSAPGGYFGIAMLSMLAWLLIGGWWCLRVGMFLLLSVLYRQPLYLHKPRWLGWLIAPLLVVGTVGVVALEVPALVAFALSRPGLEQLARDARANPQDPPAPGWVGLYPVRNVEVVENDGVRFIIPGTGFMGRHGLAHYPQGSVAAPWTMRHWYGNWYTWVEDW